MFVESFSTFFNLRSIKLKQIQCIFFDETLSMLHNLMHSYYWQTSYLRAGPVIDIVLSFKDHMWLKTTLKGLAQ